MRNAVHFPFVTVGNDVGVGIAIGERVGDSTKQHVCRLRIRRFKCQRWCSRRPVYDLRWRRNNLKERRREAHTVNEQIDSPGTGHKEAIDEPPGTNRVANRGWITERACVPEMYRAVRASEDHV